MKSIFTSVFVVLYSFILQAQSSDKTVYFDLAHKQRFWNDSKDMVPNIGLEDSSRINYLNQELDNTLGEFNAKVSFLKKTITYELIKKGDLLILHVPSSKYEEKEIKAIQKFVNKGGKLLVVMEADYWTDLKKTNVNKILAPYEITYGEQSQDTLAGGYTKKGALHSEKLKVTYQLGRIVKGGTPFSFNSQDNQPFGVYKKVKNGGRLVVLGDAMSSLYMTEWKGVSDYQCREFMLGIYRWLFNE
ncbi:hypothetical protein U6A24_04810 [Aquimarina gracilis]|uniref:IFT52 GIFT domain-containing protein n=1 Tax=Aquimarina gracilis TaxID=874422 RepID=A0ABU5ZSI9_9FLAO|nr:hypothetical protein [Aquimarina gracilis]MEB3344766.1 hypothetical protein [Aquimarina gracilis]